MSDPSGTLRLCDSDEKRLAEFLRQGGIFCAGLPPPSALAHLAWAARTGFMRPFVWIADGPRSLDVLYQDLSTLAGQDASPLFFYPAWECFPGSGAVQPADLAGDRLATLQRCLSDREPVLIATCIQALMQKAPDPATLRDRSRRIRTGDQVELDDLCAMLGGSGYDFQHEVQAKGQASRRGGILDIWPPASEWPLRIELFGSTVESIRAFDPAEQRSVEALSDCALSPAREGACTASLASYLPPETVWVWVEPDRIEHHVALYEEMIREARAEAAATRFDASGLRYQVHFTLAENRVEHRFAFESLEGVPSLGAGRLRPDLMADQRERFIAGLARRASEGWTVRVYFSTQGALQRFAETLSGGATQFDLRLGTLSEGYASDALKHIAVAESDFHGRRKEMRGRYDLHAKRAGPTPATGDRIADWSEIQPGDLVVHVDHGIGKYRGLFEIEFNGEPQEVLTIEYADAAKLYVPVSQTHLLSRYVGVGKQRPPLHTLGGKRWQKDKIAAEKAVQDLAASLLQTQAVRDSLPGHAFAHDTTWQMEFEASFPFQETPDQAQAIDAVKRDMENPRPMDRLVCGDVGYGKTEVAMRAAFKAVMDGKQVALLVPTTVLAQQHYDTFSQRMAAWPARIEMLSRFQTPAEQDDIVRRLDEGTADIVIGTHRLVQKDVRFKDLGLVIIDEEQRFGVKHKEHLKQMRKLVDVLTLTATPIPRTLYLSLTGAKDLSTIQTPPVERMPIETLVVENTDEVVRHAILSELNREGQVYFLHNRVQSIENAWQRLRKIAPEARIEIAHGQMPEKQLAFIMRSFVRGEFDVLLCTTIIESGLDIPNVNTIVIERADRFGLAELYQLRGRVGRYKRKAYAYLLLPKHGQLFDTARKRIGAIKRYSHLGAGFRLALRDLEIRGAGNILGAEQSGHIAAVGFDLYCQLLKRTVAHLKGEALPPIVDVEMKLDFIDLSPRSPDGGSAAVIPADYVEDESQRIDVYRKLAGAGTPAELDAERERIRDRFGRIPPALDRLLKTVRLRLDAAAKSVTAIETQGDKVLLTRRGDFVTVENKFPRLKAKSPGGKLDELREIVRRLM
jgi:transcription-repair coupling factor (superfamily II helicase)